jgi:hypothetical protein
MRPRNSRSAALLLLLLLSACATPLEEGSRSPAVGEAAPPIELSIATGGEFSLADTLREKNVVVVFYRGRF